MIKNNYQGKFIVFEGLDGSGQSTQAELLKTYLAKEKKKKVIATKEPTQGEIGLLIRQVLQHKVTLPPEALQLLFCADRSCHLEHEIIPALKNGRWVICDRYVFSTIAFGALKLNINWLTTLNENFLMPDVTLLLKVKPGICIERIDKNRGKREFFEQEEILKKVWNNYIKLTKKFKNIFVVDGEQSIEKVSEDIKKIIEKSK